MRNFLILFFLLPIGSLTFSQTTFTATQNGNWNVGTTWGGACTSGCSAGVDYPGISDDANTGGFLVNINGQFICRNVLVDKNTVGFALRFLNPATSLTINGSLIGYDNGFGLADSPETSLVTGIGRFIFTGSNTNGLVDQGITNEVLAFWNSNSPLARVEFNLSGTSTIDFFYDPNTSANDYLLISNSLTVNSGTLQTGVIQIDQIAISQTLTIASGATLETSVPLNGDGSNTSTIGTVDIDGTLNCTDQDSYVNSNTFNLNPGSLLQTSFSAISDQTEGWWYQSVAPTTVVINSNSTVTFSANADQNIPALSLYGNLTLSADTDLRSKTIAGAGTFIVRGNFNVSTANVQFSSTNTSTNLDFQGNIINEGSWSSFANTNIRFTGSSAQTVTGGGEVDIPVNLVINNTSGVSFSTSVAFTGTTTISGTGEPSFTDLTVASVLTSSTGTINVAGNFTNNGTFNRNNGTVNFNGTSTIDGSQTTAFNNLTASGTSVAVNGSADLHGTLSLSAGTFDADGSGDTGILTVKSTGQTGDGRIASLSTPNNFTGDVTIERFLQGATGGDFRYISIPITNGNLGMWSDDFPVTGSFSGLPPNGSDNVVNNSLPSVFRYDATTANNWEALNGGGGPTSGVALTNGVGYSAYSYRDNDQVAVVRGQIGKGDAISVPVSSTPGRFNLIGNPYPSPIDGNQLLDNNTVGFGTTFYIRTSNGVFASYNASSNSGTGHPSDPGWNGEIQMGQSFWVVGNGATSLNFTESLKVEEGSGQFLRERDAPLSQVRIALSNEEQRDETIVIFRDEASANYDSEFDGYKYFNGYRDINGVYHPYMNLSSFNDDESVNYVFNTISAGSCLQTVNLNVRDVAEGTYNLTFADMESFQVPYHVVLVDNFASKRIIVTHSTSYEFEVTPDTRSYGKDRFDLHFEAVGIDETVDLEYETIEECNMSYVTFNLSNGQYGLDYLLMNDDVVVDSLRSSPSSQQFFVDKQVMSEGKNTFSVKAKASMSCGVREKLYKELITYDNIQQWEVTKVENASVCSGESITFSVQGTAPNGYYRWYETVESLEPIPGENNSSLTLDSANDNIPRYYVSVVTQGGCESERIAVSAEVINIETPIIQVGEGFLTVDVPNDRSIQWYLDDEPMEQATTDTIKVVQEGVYSVEVSKGSCSVFSLKETVLITSIMQAFGDQEINVYPNPAKDYITIDITGKNALNITEIVVKDTWGQVLKKVEISPSEQNDDGFKLDISYLSPGVYILSLGNGVSVRFIKN